MLFEFPRLREIGARIEKTRATAEIASRHGRGYSEGNGRYSRYRTYAKRKWSVFAYVTRIIATALPQKRHTSEENEKIFECRWEMVSAASTRQKSPQKPSIYSDFEAF